MGNRWDVVRLDYLFAVIIPCLIAVYVNDNVKLVDHLQTIAGWAFLGIGGNVINDMIDQDRDLGWHQKELAAVALGSIFLGILSLARCVLSNPLNALWIGLAVALVLGYCVWFKRVPVLSTVGQVIPEVMFPYFTITMPSSLEEWLWVTGLLFFSFLSQIMHESIDREAISKKYSLGQLRLIVFAFSIITMAIGAAVILMTGDITILPFGFVPVATMYIFRHKNQWPSKNLKDIGIILGNLFMVYFLVLILAA